MLPNVNYIGNKKKIVDWLIKLIPSDVISVVDGFSGGGSVAYSLKSAGYRVIANDMLYSSFELNKAFVENNEVILSYEHLENANKYNASENVKKRLSFLSQKLYFPDEVEELAGLVGYAEDCLQGYEYSIYLSLLRRAMIRKLPYSRMNINWDNITKLRDEEYSYEKYGRRRAYHNQSFIEHMYSALDEYNMSVFKGKRQATVEQLDILDLIEKYPSADLLYMDPPYPGTMNNYDAFYGPFDDMFTKHVKHIDLTGSENFMEYMEDIFNLVSKKYKYAMISLNNSIKPSFSDFVKMISQYGNVEIFEKKHNYQISGSKTKEKNLELVALVTFN